MITLTGQREISGVNIYRDDADPLAFYIMPQSPRIALDDAGKPIFSLVWYRRKLDNLTDEQRKTQLGGGILAASVELSTTDKQMAEIKKELSSDPSLQRRTGLAQPKLADALKISTVPVSDGTVAIAILAEDGSKPGDFVSSLVGAGRVSMTGRERAAFMAKLTMDGVALLWDMVEKNLPGIRVAYDLKFYHRLNGVTMRVFCDAKKAFQAIQQQWQNASDDASWSETHSPGNSTYTYGDDQADNARNRLFSVVQNSEAARVDIIPEAGDDAIKPDEITQLEQMGNEMIKDFLSETFLDFKPGSDWKAEDDEPTPQITLASQDGKKYGHGAISDYHLKDWNESVGGSLDYTFHQQAVLEGHLAPNDNLANVLQGKDPTAFRTVVDLDPAQFRFIDVGVICNANFDDDPLTAVTAHFEYHGRSSDGRQVDKAGDVVFNKTSAPQHFATYLAAPDQTTYAYSAQVVYKGTDQSYSFSGEDKRTILVLDVDRLGILRVDMQVGICDWSQIQQAEIDLWYGSGPSRRESRFVFDSQHQSARWVEPIAQPITDPYNYQVTWIDKTGQRLPMDRQTSMSKNLVLDAPLAQQLEVTLIPAGDFGSNGLIKSIAVALRYLDEANDYRMDHTEVITSDRDAKIWRVPLRNKDLRTFQYQQTIIYSGGGDRGTRELPWTTTDNPIVVVGDPFTFRVRALPYLLKAGGYSFGTLSLRFDDTDADGHPIHYENDFELSDFAKPVEWHILLGAADRHTYSYQLKLYKADGSEVDVPAASDDKEILVLVPPK